MTGYRYSSGKAHRAKQLPVICMLMMFLLPAASRGQDLDSLLAILESHREEDIFSFLTTAHHYHTIYTGMDYRNRTYYAGRDIGVQQYNLTVHASYHYRGFTAGAGSLIYSQFEPHWNMSFISLAYRKQLLKDITLDGAISGERYISHSANDSLTLLYPNGLRAGLFHYAPHWGLMFEPSLYFGGGITAQLNAGVYGNIRLLRLKGGHRFMLMPEMNLVFGYAASAYAQMPGSGTEEDTGVFGLMNTEFRIPLTWYWKDLDMRVALHFNFPRDPGGVTEYAPTRLISAGAGYMFSIQGGRKKRASY